MMSYYANSAWEYLATSLRQLQAEPGGGRRLLVTVPQLTEAVTLALAEVIQSRCTADGSLALTLKIAGIVTDGWSASGIAKAREQGWFDDQGTLTSYRNQPSVPGQTSLVVLIGADRVPDAGSLADFHRLDENTLWQAQLGGSLGSWVDARLKREGLPGLDRAAHKEFDRLLTPLLDSGKADLATLSDWLERLDLGSAATLRDVQRIMLGSLARFRLPRMTGFARDKKRGSLLAYIERATAFFSYTQFLEPKERKKALKALEAISAARGQGGALDVDLEDEVVRGGFPDGQAYLDGLRSYIEREDPEARERLLTCDFVTLADKVLKFKKKAAEHKERVRKLTGSPIEVVLHALWRALADFHQDKQLAGAELLGIEVKADRFKHDYEGSADSGPSGTAAERNELAQEHLHRLLGGVDALITDRASLPVEGGEPLRVVCRLEENTEYSYAKTAEPLLEFSVHVRHGASETPLRCRFAWRLPEIQQYRLAETLLQWAAQALAEDSATWRLPVFHLQHYEELLRSTDDEETRRVLLHCLRDARPSDQKMTNLLVREWLNSGDPLLPSLKHLAECYDAFINAANGDGLHRTLLGEHWGALRKAYAAACRAALGEGGVGDSQMAAMLLRCFLGVARRGPEFGVAWTTEPYEQSAVATVLHPAVLEMLEAQVVFLLSCFNAAGAIELARVERRARFAESVWNGYVDLASISAPIAGLLYDENQNLDTNVRGEELIHRVGSIDKSNESLSTRLLVRYDAAGDEDLLTDTEMFRESRESKLLFRLLKEYFGLHPHARDGLHIAIYRNKDIQPVIAAVHQYINLLSNPKKAPYFVLGEDRQKRYALGITLFCESGDGVDVARWIEQWKERWEAAESEKKFAAYKKCRFSVAHRIVDTKQRESFRTLVEQSFESDIAVLYDFIRPGEKGNKFVKVAPFDVRTRTLKFPILEKSFCAVRQPIDQGKRSRIIGNRQFYLGTLHTQVMCRLKTDILQPQMEFMILGVGDFAPWRRVVEAFHQKAEWVICIDPSMDERLIYVPAGGQSREREIIGFGSGVGSHGEANYTISTEQFSLADVRVRLAAAIAEVYSGAGWSAQDHQLVAESVLREARTLSGLSLVRATGAGQYIRDFTAYSLTRKILRGQDSLLCDHLISLDAYRHWFDLAESEQRPDLLWLTAWIDDDQRICLRAHLIECKLAQRADEHLRKAQAQIDNGLKVLVPAFAPRSLAEDDVIEDNRPDQRYWWLQLHRLIASKAEIENSQQERVLSALERLAEGDYQIQWDGSVFAFWSDDPAAEPVRTGSWVAEGQSGVTASLYELGSEFVRTLALGAPGYPKTWAEWDSLVSSAAGNICERLEEVELPKGEDQDELVLEEPAGEPLDELDDESWVEEVHEPSRSGESGPETPAEEPEANDGLPLPQPEPTSHPVEIGRVDSGTAVAESPIPQRILLGTTTGGLKPVYWEFGHSGLANRHMLIFGTAGYGKTYAIQCLLCELARLDQNSLIVDYTTGFIHKQLEKETSDYLNPCQHVMGRNPLPMNLFRLQQSDLGDELIPESKTKAANRISSIFKTVYGMGDQQSSVLFDAIVEGIGSYKAAMSVDRMMEILERMADEDRRRASVVQGVINKIKPFVLEKPFDSSPNVLDWEGLFSDEIVRCHVFQLAGFDKTTCRIATEFILWDLYSHLQVQGSTMNPKVIVLDEVQNLDMSDGSPLAKYIREGRKFGISLITATQIMSDMAKEERDILFNSAHKLFFRPADTEMNTYADVLSKTTGEAKDLWQSRLAALKKGECISLGPSIQASSGRLDTKAYSIKIASLAERGFHG